MGTLYKLFPTNKQQHYSFNKHSIIIHHHQLFSVVGPFCSPEALRARPQRHYWYICIPYDIKSSLAHTIFILFTQGPTASHSTMSSYHGYPPQQPILSPHTHHATSRHRQGLVFLILASCVFIIIGLGSHSGWAFGTVLTRTAYDTPTVSAVCPPDILDNATSCTSSQTAISSIDTSFDYGLFRDLVYTTINTTEVTTNTYALVNTTSKLVRTDINSSMHTDTITQGSYQEAWAKGNPPHNMIKVEVAQSCLVLAWWFSIFAGILLVIGIYLTPLRQAAKARILLGARFLWASTACLFLTCTVWCGVSLHALTHMCVATTEGGAEEGNTSYHCTQLLSDTCAELLTVYPTGWCETTSEVLQRGGAWSLIFFTCVLQITASYVFKQFYDVVLANEEEDAEEEAILNASLREAILPQHLPDERQEEERGGAMIEA